jgi:hypothetical protein
VTCSIFRIEENELPVMVCGSSLFVGMGYYGFHASDLRIKFYKHPERMAEIFSYFVKKGCKGVQVLCYTNILRAAKIAQEKDTFPVAAVLVASLDVDNQLEMLGTLNTDVVFVSATQTDLVDEKQLQKITGKIRDAGMVPGLATGVPGVSIFKLEEMDIDFSAYLVPVNKLGVHMRPNKEKTLDAITGTKRVILGMNPLAQGKLSPEEGFPFVMEYCQGFCLGFTSVKEIDAAYTALDQLLQNKK